jgi:hypothetical protein
METTHEPKPGDIVIAEGEDAKIVEWDFRVDMSGSWAYLERGDDQFACLQKNIKLHDPVKQPRRPPNKRARG